MGLGYTDLKILWSARRAGAKFTRIACIGRQALRLHASERCRLEQDISDATLFDEYEWGSYCEPYLKTLFESQEILSIDYSDYQNAQVVHDMNTPLPLELRGQFDLVIDGGSLEHIFNFPVAISNLMSLAKVGGYVFTANPANNLCGHGFYQFSPELMYRVFSADNGFSVEEMVLSEHRFASVELAPVRRIVRVRDPRRVGTRIMPATPYPLMLRMLAKKTVDTAVFDRSPQQSDYVALWMSASPDRGDHRAFVPAYRSLMGPIYSRLPQALRFHIDGYRRRIGDRLSNRQLFEPYS